MFCCFIPPKAQKLCRLGRSSDLSFFECLPILMCGQWLAEYSKILKGLTAAGLFRTCTWFPFHRVSLYGMENANQNRHKDKKKNDCFLFCFRFPLSLWLNWFRMNVSVIRIKRESGANPGQSRCCEALLKSWKEPLPLIRALYVSGRLQD